MQRQARESRLDVHNHLAKDGMKVAAGGPIDLVDAESALVADPKSLDVQLVRRLGSRFGKSASASLEKMLGDLGFGHQASHSRGKGLDEDLE